MQGLHVQVPGQTEGDQHAREPQAQRKLSGVERYQRGRAIRDTLQGKVRYGVDRSVPDDNADKWVIIKESAKNLVERGLSRRGDPIREDVRQEIITHRAMCSDPIFHTIKPYILSQLDALEDSSYIYQVLEWAQGGDLFKFISERESVNQWDVATQGVHPYERDVIKIAGQLCVALFYMHKVKRVCHRDLSLENLMLNGKGDLLVIDFGVAKDYSQSRSFATLRGQVGKLSYMPPEVFHNSDYDGSLCDMWTVGVILFICGVGSPPYELPTQQDPRFSLVIRGRVKRLLEHWNVVDRYTPAFVDFIQRLMLPERQRLTLDQMIEHEFLRSFWEDARYREQLRVLRAELPHREREWRLRLDHLGVE